MFYLKEPRVSVEWQDGETALKSALRMEKKANTKFMTILNLALEKHDPHVSIMTKYIQVFPQSKFLFIFASNLFVGGVVVIGVFNSLCNQCISPLMSWVQISNRPRCTTLCDKVCLLLKVALNNLKKRALMITHEIALLGLMAFVKK